MVVTKVKVEISEIVEEDEETKSKRRLKNRGLDVFQPLFQETSWIFKIFNLVTKIRLDNTHKKEQKINM